MASNRAPTKSPPVKTDLDDWETDPDYVRDMDEIDQRWGSKRTVGSINMNDLIDQVQRDHKTMREKFGHPSQRDYSDGFGGKYGIQHDRKDQSAHDFDYHEKLSKHTSQEISKKVITSSTSSVIKSGVIDEAKRTFLEKSQNSFSKDLRADPNIVRPTYQARRSDFGGSSDLSGSKSPSSLFEKSSSTKHIVREEKSSTTSRGPSDMPQAFKSIQEKINAFKKEFEDIESKLNKKADISKVIKKTSNYDRGDGLEYVNRSAPNASLFERKLGGQSQPTSGPAGNTYQRSYVDKDLPKTSIKSLSEKFESLKRDDNEQFRRETEVKRREFFDQIKSQVRETRKELDGFDSIDDGEEIPEMSKLREKLDKLSPPSTMKSQSPRFSPTPSAASPRPSSRLSDNQSNLSSSTSTWKPKVYTKRETTEERVISRIVKENDRVIENETKRDVKRSSSCHGSSDEDEDGGQPSSIKLIDRELRSSPQSQQYGTTSPPADRLKRETPPIVQPEIKGAGLMARTLYDYQATESDELSFDVDDLITNIKKVHADWYEGTITYRDGRKQVGLFPANYVKLLNDSSDH